MSKFIDVGRIADRAEAAAKLARLADETPLGLRDAGLVLNFSSKHIWRLISAGNDGVRIPRFYRPEGSRAWRVSAGTLRRWLAEQEAAK